MLNFFSIMAYYMARFVCRHTQANWMIWKMYWGFRFLRIKKILDQRVIEDCFDQTVIVNRKFATMKGIGKTNYLRPDILILILITHIFMASTDTQSGKLPHFKSNYFLAYSRPMLAKAVPRRYVLFDRNGRAESNHRETASVIPR